MSAIKKVILVGHCGADSYGLASAVQHAAPTVQVTSASSQRELDTLGPDALLLVNRELDGGFATDSGIELIEHVRQRNNSPVAMLISNYDWAQQQAQEAGALPGFGKSSMHSEQTISLLRSVLNGNL